MTRHDRFHGAESGPMRHHPHAGESGPASALASAEVAAVTPGDGFHVVGGPPATTSGGVPNAIHPSRIAETLRVVRLQRRRQDLDGMRFRWSLMLLPLIAVALALGIRDVSRTERVLADDGARAARVIVYELAPGTEVRVPIEPDTDVVRVVAHAVWKGPRPLQSPSARLLVTAKGQRGARADDLALSLPFTSDRVTIEDDDGVSAGDPTGVDVDVHSAGKGELTIALKALAGADAIVVRLYAREVLGERAAAKRTEHLTEARAAHLAHLARRAGEIDFIDMDESDRLAVLGTRWRRVAALGSAQSGLVVRAIALAPQPPAPPHATDAPPLFVTDVDDKERVSVIAHAATTLRARLDGEVDAQLFATVRNEDGSSRTVQGSGEVTVDLAPNGTKVAVEISANKAGLLAIRASNPAAIEPRRHAVAWRTTPVHPAIVTATEDAIVLRVAARRPLSRAMTTPVPIELDASIVEGTQRRVFRLHATRARSVVDRYEMRSPVEAPSEKAVFHVLIPPHASLALTPVGTALDLTLSELDPRAAPRPLAPHVDAADPADPEADPPARAPRLDEWTGFVSRVPTNGGEFDAGAMPLVRLAPSLAAREHVEEPPQRFRIAKGRADREPDEIARLHDRTFVPSSVAFAVDVSPHDGAILLPITFFAEESMNVIVRIDGDTPRRREIGTPQFVTTTRTITVLDEVKAGIVFGDDLRPGTHVVTFTAPPGKKLWVSGPWMDAKPKT